MPRLTKKQKLTQVKKQIRAMMQEYLKNKLLPSVDTSFNSGMIPDYLIEEDNYLLAKAIIDGAMRQRPYAPHDKRLQKDFDNIYLSF
jgi:hypothetical protein